MIALGAAALVWFVHAPEHLVVRLSPTLTLHWEEPPRVALSLSVGARNQGRTAIRLEGIRIVTFFGRGEAPRAALWSTFLLRQVIEPGERLDITLVEPTEELKDGDIAPGDALLEGVSPANETESFGSRICVEARSMRSGLLGAACHALAPDALEVEVSIASFEEDPLLGATIDAPFRPP